MGYTHYWDKVDMNEEFVQDVKKILATTDIPVALEFDTKKKPQVDLEDGICLNGIEDDGHETFYFTDAASSFNFCKTARKPYDTVVTAILTAAIFRRVATVSSDGFFEEWVDGIALYEEARGSKLSDEDRDALAGLLGTMEER